MGGSAMYGRTEHEWQELEQAGWDFLKEKAAERLPDLRETYRTRPRGTSGRAAEVIDLLFASPILTVRYVQQELGVSRPGATNLLRRLTAHGMLREQGSGTGRGHRWFSEEILSVLDPEGSA